MKIPLNRQKLEVGGDDVKEDILISIIIPAYNAEKTIDEAIQSVFQQTYQKWELIIINNGSLIPKAWYPSFNNCNQTA